MAKKEMSPEEQANYNAEVKHERAVYISSLPDEVRDKAFASMADMPKDQQNVIWDRMRENETQQPQVQTPEPSM